MAEYIQQTIDFVRFYAENFWFNATHMFDGMYYKQYIRLAAIIGGYILIRPYIEKFIAKTAAPRLAREAISQPTEADKAKTMASITPNGLRGVQLPEESDAEEGATGTGADAGKAARKRARQFIKRESERKNRTAVDEEDDWTDPDVSDLLDFSQAKRT